MIIECSNIKKTYLGKDILKDVSFKVNDHDKISIIGVNGAGKTTILKMISDEEEYDSGNIYRTKNKSIGYLKQIHDLDLNDTVYNNALTVFDNLISIEKKLRSLEEEMAINYTESISKEYDELTKQFDSLDGYSYPSRLNGVLKGLGFKEDEYDMLVSSLSGGQKTRLALSKILLQVPDLLLLDEPTNHLDYSAISFLEGYLKSYPKSFIIVTHDRYLIDRVSNKIIEIENGKSKTYNCNYEQYSFIKTNNRNIELKHYTNQQKEIKRIQQSIDTLKSYNREKSIKRAESKEKQLEKIEKIDKPESLPSSITINFKPNRDSGFEVLKIEDLSAKYDDILFSNINIDIKKNERVALLGQNGIGKTTLFNIILSKLPAYKGRIKMGSKVDVAYYDQEHSTLSLNKTIFNEIRDTYPKLDNTQIRNTLAMFNFRGDDVLKDINVLSGGEKGRVVLAKILLSKANLLILDEPTNHLDISSKEVLEEALLAFEGTVLFISHDRYFINKIATRVVELTHNQAIDYEGNYDDYLLKKESIKEVKSENFEYKEFKQRQSNDRKIQNEIRKLEKSIDKVEKEIIDLNKELLKEEVINDYNKYNDIDSIIKEKEAVLNELLIKWEQLNS